MSIRELADDAARVAKDVKAQQAADRDTEDRPALAPCVQGWRGTERVVVMIPDQVDRDAGLKAAWICATGFGCDSIAFTVDTWSAKVRTNPVTGRRWGPREMQDAADNHDGVAKGWITDGLSTFVVNRAGDIATVMQQYSLTAIHPSKWYRKWRWSIEWGERYTDDPNDPGRPDKVEGIVPEALLAYMNEPTMMQSIGTMGVLISDYGLDNVEAMAHADCAVVKTLLFAGFTGAAMLQADDDRRAEIIERSLGSMGQRL